MGRIFPNEIVAQSYLAVVLKRPSDARRRKKVWGQLYSQIFEGSIREPYITASQIYVYTKRWLGQPTHSASADMVTRTLANIGAFYVARVAAYLWRGTDDWKSDPALLRKQVLQLDSNPELLDSFLARALQILKSLLEQAPHYIADIDSALKQNSLDAELDRNLHTSALDRQ